MNESDMNESEQKGQLPADTGENIGLAGEAVDAIENLSGVHPGYRRAHARGICCRGFFRPSGLGMEFTEAAHLQEQQVNAIVRFSGSSTDPAVADLLSPAKGMAVQFILPEGEVTNLVGVTVPVFFARTPESFIDIVRTAHRLRTGTLGPLELMKEIVSHFTESKESLLAVKRLKPPASYAESQYFCIHAYVLVNAEGRKQPVRFEWVPESGVRTLSAEAAAQQPDNYLEDELELRFKDEPAIFQLIAVLGEEGDATDDPTRTWPEDRRRVDLGRLHISEIIPEPEGLVMDPARITSGMLLSDDPILSFRSAAYAESYHRRTTER
ncbi:catalase family peroxidase [Paenibacillus tritici]|uniref:Catalase-related peroxidase n=2 Tax=Paenibacillus tritici TaxID=1873425 RepID=A0ABX2DP72_9BACL|nr:catalase family peroxidase [Paenibacillus tritici]NQX46419.1 catalase family peroxidase [Paenibacillus tritici]QUL58508.1 catalase family peroxidase [Paenibacillus tritici]